MALYQTALGQSGESATKQARRHLEAGRTLSAMGQQDAALAEFTRAYELAKLPGFLFNIALVQRRLENLDKAQESLTQFIATAEEGSLKKTAQAQLKEIETIIAASGDEREALLIKERERSKNEQKEELASMLDPKKGLLVISSTPPNCRIVIDGGRVPDDLTPFTGFLPPGRYVVDVSAEGYDAHIEQVTISAKKAQALVVNMKRKPSSLIVRIAPEGGRVEVDGKEIGEGAKIGPIELPSGEHEVVVRSQGFQPWKRQIALVPGQPTDISVDLVPDKNNALKLASYGAFGVSGASIATAGIFGLVARNKAKDFEIEIANDAEFDADAQELFDEGVAAEKREIAFFIVGGSTAVIGGALYGVYWFVSKEEPTSARWQLSPTLGGANFALHW